jgi:hypothetical protein
MNHTPGPWRIYAKQGSLEIGSQNLNGDGDYVCDVYNQRDAKLIAAAPDLLYALELLIEFKGHVAINSVGDVRLQGKLLKAMEQARAAIAKAETSI